MTSTSSDDEDPLPTDGSVRSLDGTAIGFTRTGVGPNLGLVEPIGHFRRFSAFGRRVGSGSDTNTESRLASEDGVDRNPWPRSHDVIQHTVAFRLHDDADAEAFWARVADLDGIVGVQRFATLRQIGRKNDFTHALSMFFDSQKHYDEYDADPVHVAFVNEAWLPNVGDFIELDYVED